MLKHKYSGSWARKRVPTALPAHLDVVAGLAGQLMHGVCDVLGGCVCWQLPAYWSCALGYVCMCCLVAMEMSGHADKA